MSTNYIAPIWRMPENTNNVDDKLSNYSIDFNGSSTVINISNNPIFDLGTAFTISGWFNFNYTNQTKGLISFDSSTTRGWFLYTYLNQIRFLTSPTTYYTLYTGYTTTNQWDHFLITYDGTDLVFYINGIQESTQTVSINLQTNGLDGQIGNNQKATGRYFKGKISQISIFDYALSTNQINYIYNLNNPMAITGAKPIAYWPLGDNSNPNAPGSFPSISTGTDSVFDFNTSGAWIDCGNNPVFNVGTGDLSISAWVYPTSVSGNVEVCDIGAIGGTRIRLQRRSARIGAYIDSAAGVSSMDGTTTLSINQWYHFVLIKSGSSFNLYLNGSEVSEASYTNTGSFTDTEVTIGQYFGGTANKWEGELSNIQIWNSALTISGPNSDLKTLYNNGQPLMTGTQPQEANLQAWYKLNQTANWEAITANTWQIPDARSAYPQSFDFTKTSGQYINLGTDDWFNEYNNEITFSVWINKKDWSSTGFESIISKYGATLQYRVVYPNSANKLTFQLQGSATSGSGYSSRADTVTLTSAQTTPDWLHILWRHSASTNTSQVIFNGDYANAVSLTNIAANPYAQPQTTVLNLIGNLENGLQPFDGAISNYQRFNSYLDNATVEALYNNGIPSTTAIAPTNSKAWYKLDNNDIWNPVLNQWEIIDYAN